jgi:transposase
MSKKTLLVGIDVHSEKNYCAFTDDLGNRLLNKAFSVPNNLPGAQELEKRIESAIQEGGFEGLKIATEATSFLDLHLVDYLSNSKSLAKYLPLIYQFNPKLTAGLKKAYADIDKTDYIDPFIIAERLRFGKIPEPYEGSRIYFPLKRLTRFRHHLVSSIAREKNYFLTHLFLKFSSFSTLKPFGSTFGKTSLAVITDFLSVDELAAMPVEELVNFIIKQGKNRFKEPEKTAEAVNKAARESYRIRPSLASSVNLILASTIQNIRALTASLKEVNDAIAKEFAAFPNTLQSVKGIGPVYAAGIFTELGDIKRFGSQAKVAKFAGLTWRKRKSGKYESEHTRLTKTGNRYLRYYLMEAANSLRVHNEEYKAYYQKKYKEVTKHRHKRAVALTARKLVRLVFALLTKRHLWQSLD